MNRPHSKRNLIKLTKFVLFYVAFLIGAITAPFSMESSSIHIAVLENPSLIQESPFASRVQIFEHSPLEENDDEVKEHSVAVCSVLVGKDSILPKDTLITLVPSIDLFSSYLEHKNPKDLIILNWSGLTCYPGLSEEALDDLENIKEHFNTILGMGETDFTKQVHDYIQAYDDMLIKLQRPDSPLTILLCYAKESLLTAVKQTRTEEDKNKWSSGVSEKIEHFKKHGEEQAKARFAEMKEILLKSLAQHDNTLIVWALGNDGENIDNDPFWQGLLRDERILSHTLLVHGVTPYGQRAKSSNFTVAYREHSLGKPNQTFIWDMQESKYLKDDGTSFSAPLATINAFIEATKMSDQTGQTPSYTDIKNSLLKK